MYPCLDPKLSQKDALRVSTAFGPLGGYGYIVCLLFLRDSLTMWPFAGLESAKVASNSEIPLPHTTTPHMF